MRVRRILLSTWSISQSNFQEVHSCYAGNSTEVDFSNYKYVGFNIPCPKRVVFCGINSTQSRIHSRNSTGVFTRQTTVHSPKNRLPLRKHTCTSLHTRIRLEYWIAIENNVLNVFLGTTTSRPILNITTNTWSTLSKIVFREGIQSAR